MSGSNLSFWSESIWVCTRMEKKVWLNRIKKKKRHILYYICFSDTGDTWKLSAFSANAVQEQRRIKFGWWWSQFTEEERTWDTVVSGSFCFTTHLVTFLDECYYYNCWKDIIYNRTLSRWGFLLSPVLLQVSLPLLPQACSLGLNFKLYNFYSKFL